MSDTFDWAIDFIFAVEGYVSNDKHDSGGYTKYGIAQNAHPDVDVKNLTIDDAKGIYKTDYWKTCKCDRFSPALGLYLMDFAVNSGTKSAAVGLQRTVNKLTAGTGTLALAEDGKIGEKTIAAVNALPEQLMVAAYHAYRVQFYFNLVAKKASQSKFLRGWMNRISKLNMYANGASIKRMNAML